MPNTIQEVVIDNTRYRWCGGYGAVVKSFERGVRIGDVRIIGEDLLYAHLVYPRFLRPYEVCWTFIEPTNERINEFHRKLFGCSS